MAIDVMGLKSRNPQSAPLRFAVLNRGEAAVRFMRTAKVWARTHDRAVETIAFYTDPDVAMPFVRMADHAVHLGDAFTITPEGARVSSYLDVERLVALCQQHGVTAVWPGWGFLGESAELSEALAEAGIVFFGPSADVMRLLADKIASKKFAESHDVPVSPWSGEEVSSYAEAAQIAPSIGFPLITKAAAGGGGRGIRLVERIEDLEAAFHSAGAEALAAFGDDALFLEAYVDQARHVEVQILADTHETVWSLGTRDCSVQRRHQKVLEEAPAPMLAEGVEERICAAARRLAAACNYQGAGTAEFLLLPDGETFYFLEMNARLQVEHTVTETLFGFDIVGAQIDVAFGQRLAPAPPARRGAAIEARLNAEEPDMGFAPAGGRISTFDLPGGPGVRVDSGFRAGDRVSGAFDSNLAKIIAWGRDRSEALARLEQALRDTRVAVEGGLTNRALILEVLADDDFVNMRHSTRWLDHYIERRPKAGARPHLVPALIAASLVDAAAARKEERAALFAHVHAGPPQRLSASEPRLMRYLVDGQPVEASVAQLAPGRFAVRAGEAKALVDVEWVAPDSITFVVDGERYSSLIARSSGWIQVNTRDVSHRFERVPDGRIAAEMSAVVTQVAVEPGQSVARGDRLLTLEVMKMEIHLDAPMAGVVEAIHVGPATQVNPGEPLLEMRPAEQEGAEAEQEGEAQPIDWDRAPRDPDAAAVLRAGVLGYEVTETEFAAALERLASDGDAIESAVALDALEALVTSRALFLEGPHDDAVNAAGESSAAQTFWFLQNRRLDEERLNPRVARRIERLLALHGVTDLDRPRAIEAALFRLFQTRLRETKRQRAISVFLDALLQRWSRGALSQEEIARALGMLDGLERFTTLNGAHELTLRVGHLGHRLRGFSDGSEKVVAPDGDAHPLLDVALAHTVTLQDFELRALPRSVDRTARARPSRSRATTSRIAACSPSPRSAPSSRASKRARGGARTPRRCCASRSMSCVRRCSITITRGRGAGTESR